MTQGPTLARPAEKQPTPHPDHVDDACLGQKIVEEPEIRREALRESGRVDGFLAHPGKAGANTRERPEKPDETVAKGDLHGGSLPRTRPVSIVS